MSDLSPDIRAALLCLILLLAPAVFAGINCYFRWRYPTDADRLWHEYAPFLFVRLADGSLNDPNGKIWRRWTGTRWEYRQDPETKEDLEARS